MGDREAERLASLEAKMDLILKNVEELNKTLQNNYPTRLEVDVRLQSIDREIAEMKQELGEVKKAPGKWVDRAFAVGGVVIALLAFVYKN